MIDGVKVTRSRYRLFSEFLNGGESEVQSLRHNSSSVSEGLWLPLPVTGEYHSRILTWSLCVTQDCTR